jgi:hypothetical protein
MINVIVAGLAKKGLDLIAGAVAKKGTDFIKEKTGIDLSSVRSEDDIGDQEIELLREYQETNRAEILAYLTERDKTALARTKLTFDDTVNAREMQVSTMKSNKVAGMFVYILSSYLMIVSTAYIAFITFGTIPPQNVRFADVILGFVMGTIVSAILNFYFGSSRSSQAKDDTISRALNG